MMTIGDSWMQVLAWAPKHGQRLVLCWVCAGTSACGVITTHEAFHGLPLAHQIKDAEDCWCKFYERGGP